MRIKFITISFICLCLPMIVFSADSPPPIPLFVYGEVSINEMLVGEGVEISAEMESQEVAATQTNSEGKYYLEIPDGEENEGKTVTFKVAGIFDEANQIECANIMDTSVVNLDLNITITDDDSEDDEDDNSGGGSSGGGGGSYTPPIDESGLSDEKKVFDTNGDDKVDILDFNSLMANWGTTEQNNPADFDGNGTVDIFDFNLLMIYWTG